jgi:shikimate O-hydroxycinnamoyltransferase
MDGNGAFHFFQTWSALCRDGEEAVVEAPCHDRALLSPRDPPAVHPDALSVFCPTFNLSEPLGPVVTQVFVLDKDQISSLKRACGGVSTFCALSAHVWQCMCMARGLSPDSTTRLVFPANVRGSMTPPLPRRYFGNAVIILGVAGKAEDIASGDLASVASRVRGVIGRMDDELVRSAVDYLEMAKADTRPARGCLPATDVRVVSWLGMPMYDADFGWGKPVAVLRAESNRGGFVHLMDNPHGKGGVRVIVCAEAAILDDFERLLYANLPGYAMPLPDN